MMRRVARELAVFAFYLALAVAFTWPLAIDLGTSVPDRGDPLLTTFIIDWVCHALLHAPLDLYEPPIFHGGIYPLAYSENLVGVALVALPFHLAGLSALTVHNIALLLGFAFAGYGAFVLARMVTGNVPAALLAGVFHAFASFRISHVQHIHIVWSGWLPLLLAALLVYWRRPTTRSAALLGAAFVMNGLCNVYWLLYSAVTLVLTIVFLAIAEPRRESAFWIRLTASLLIAGLVLLPFLIPYQLVASEYGARRTTGEASKGSANWTDWLVPSSRNLLYGDAVDPELRRAERELFPGLLVLLLCAVPFAMRRPVGGAALDVAIVLFAILTYFTLIADRITIDRFSFSGADVPATILVALLIARWVKSRPVAAAPFTADQRAAGLWIAIGIVGSLGWNAFLHPFLFRVITPFRATRTPARWAAVAYVGLAVWAAIGMVALMERTKRRRALAALLLALAVIETAARVRWEHVDAQPAPVYRWLAETRPGVVLELPMMREGAAFRYVLASTTHRVPIINGTSGWETPLHELLRKKEERLEFDDQFLALLEQHGCTIVIVHESQLAPEQKAALQPWLARLTLVRRFGDDAVYALRTPRAPAGSASAPRGSPPR
ncbi:MAG TPA: hypothetical protein VHK90_13985 [Thermoanaerobaculia bacterium]|nr:hypothetical protein [Thermoanaerobaculia bacterium]